MKLTCNLLVLAAFSTADAFVVSPGAAASTTALKDSNYSNQMTTDRSTNFMNDNRGAYTSEEQRAGGLKSRGSSDGPRSMQRSKDIWDSAAPITVQGGALRTWSVSNPAVERVQVLMKTEGRPLNANVELWHGPDNTPQKMAFYSENGGLRPFSAVIETPRGHNAIALRNTGQMEFPFSAVVEPFVEDDIVGSAASREVMKSQEKGTPKIMQGGAIHTYPFDHMVASVQVLLKTDGRPLNARIELLQGPNNNKQVMEVYTEDGMERPFFVVVDTPGTGNVVRIVNTASVEFPLTATVQPYLLETGNGGGPMPTSTFGVDNGGSNTFLPWGNGQM